MLHELVQVVQTAQQLVTNSGRCLERDRSHQADVDDLCVEIDGDFLMWTRFNAGHHPVDDVLRQRHGQYALADSRRKKHGPQFAFTRSPQEEKSRCSAERRGELEKTRGS